MLNLIIMKTSATYQECYKPKQGFGARLLFCALLLSFIGLSKAFAQAPPAPVATAATNITCTSFEANWSAVSGSIAYFLDVSTDTTFSTFVGGFNNLNVGNVTTFLVTGMSSTSAYYYRVRVQDNNGTSLNSNTMTVYPTVMATISPITQTICSGDQAIFAISSSDPNATYSWTVTQGNVSGATAGSGNVINQTLAVTGPNSGYVYYMVTPVGNGCTGGTVTAYVSVLDCQGNSGISFVAPQNGATINNRCELQFCADSVGINQALEIRDAALDVVAYIYSGQGGTHCTAMNQYYTGTIPSGSNTFYLTAGGIFYDTVTVNVTAPIVSLQNELTYTQTATTNGGYDFTISGFSATETYTMVLNNYYNNQYDTVFVSNTTTATISHQFPYDGDFFGDIYVTADCDGSMSHDSMYVSVNNSSCSNFIALNYSSIYVNSNCGSNTVDLQGGVNYGGLVANDSSLVTINWGDGNTQTVYMAHGGNTSGYLWFPSIAHIYNAPGTYTGLVTVYNANACYVDTLIQSVTIGSTTCGSLTGNVFSDVNTNCALDNGTDIGLSYIWITATDNSNNVFYAWTDYNGNYAFNTLPNGVYTVDLAYLNSGYSITCPGSFPQTVTINNNSLVKNCAVTCSGSFDAAITGISLWSGFFPGQSDAILPHVGLLNAACNAGVSGQVKIVLDACIQYTSPSTYSGAGAPDAVISASTGDTLVWNVSDITNIGTFGYYDYAINTLTCTSAQVGDSACITMIITPTNGDADPSNNTFTRCFEIGVSYDPNNKEVMPAGEGAEGFIPADQPSLTYTLNFQNTGTAKAWNIYVMDTIETDLDINSIEILSASHKMQVYTLPNRAIKFMFANIMLPDSTNDEPNSHGYVTFKIKLNPGLAPGTEIENTGHIYFDYNEPVVTNTALNTIELPSSVQSISKSSVVRVYPNPAKENVTVLSNSSSAGIITVTDVLGKTVKEVKTTSEKTVVNTVDLESGVYFIKLAQDNVIRTEKIMITK